MARYEASHFSKDIETSGVVKGVTAAAAPFSVPVRLPVNIKSWNPFSFNKNRAPFNERSVEYYFVKLGYLNSKYFLPAVKQGEVHDPQKVLEHASKNYTEFWKYYMDKPSFMRKFAKRVEVIQEVLRNPKVDQVWGPWIQSMSYYEPLGQKYNFDPHLLRNCDAFYSALPAVFDYAWVLFWIEDGIDEYWKKWGSNLKSPLLIPTLGQISKYLTGDDTINLMYSRKEFKFNLSEKGYEHDDIKAVEFAKHHPELFGV